MPPGIGILAGMFTKYFSFYSLAACVAAAVVGIGLFLVPMESAQGQFSGSGMSTVTQVDLDSFSFVGAGELRMSLSISHGSVFIIPVFYWSGIYGNAAYWAWKSIDGDREDYFGRFVSLGPAQVKSYYYPGNRGDYYVCRFGPNDWDVSTPSVDESAGWVEVWVWTGTATSSPSAYVYDSDGNFYYVDLSIDGYVISGPSLD